LSDLLGVATPVTNFDFNTAEPGIYNYSYAAGTTNAPRVDSYGTAIVIKRENGQIWQICKDFANGYTYQRFLISGTWSNWIEIGHPDEMWVGEIAPSATADTGVPATGLMLVACISLGGYSLYIAGAGAVNKIGDNGAGNPTITVSVANGTINIQNNYDLQFTWQVQRITK